MNHITYYLELLNRLDWLRLRPTFGRNEQRQAKRLLTGLHLNPLDQVKWLELASFISGFESSQLLAANDHYSHYFKVLEQLSGIPEAILRRHATGHIIPQTGMSKTTIQLTMEKIMHLEFDIQRHIHFDSGGYFNNTRLISDPILLERVVQHAVNAFAGIRITKVLSPAVDGIPLATLLAHRLGVGLVIAKKNREVGVREFIEEVYIPSKTAIMVSLYVPLDALGRNDSVLIVDDVMDSGETQIALIQFVRKARAEVAGIFALVAINDEWKQLKRIVSCPMEVIVNLGKLSNESAREPPAQFDRPTGTASMARNPAWEFEYYRDSSGFWRVKNFRRRRRLELKDESAAG